MEEKNIIERLDNIQNLTLLAAKNVLCINDVALLTGLSKSHVYRLTCNRQIPHYKPNGKYLYFDRAEVEAWMKTNRVKTLQECEQAAMAYCETGNNRHNTKSK